MDLSLSQQPTSAMNFTENQQGSAILDKLRLQRDSGRFCDVVFHVKDQQYLAHRNVLAACSPYFDSMLKMNKVAKEHMPVVCESYSIFEVLLDYVYTGKVIIDGDSVSELMRLSNQFMITKLKEHCSEYMERNLNMTNCFSIKEQAQKCGCTNLAQTTEYFIMSNISEIIKQNEMLGFSVSQVELLLSKKNFVLSEDQKLWVITRWLKHKLKEREKACRTLLGYVMWSQINLQQLYQSIETDELFTMSECSLYHFLDILDENALLLLDYCPMLTNLRNKANIFTNTEGLLEMAVSTAITEEFSKSDDSKEHEKENNENNTEKCESADILDSRELESGIETVNKMPETRSNMAFEKEDNDGEYEPVNEDREPKALETSQLTATIVTPRHGRGKHKRKGIPVKVRISRKKVKTVKVTVPKLPKRRGRPPKKFYSAQLKKEVVEPQLLPAPPKEEEEAEDIDDEEDDLRDSDFNMDDGSDSDGSLFLKESGKKKRGRKPKEKLRCLKCFYICRSGTVLDQHMRNAHKDDTTYNCPICEFSCQWNRQYYTHMRTHFDGPPYKCDFQDCDYTCDRIQPLLYHRMIHTDERPFECTVCDMKFRTKNNLTTHLRCHTGEKPFSCPVCDRSFATKGTLEQHSVTHSDHRPYLCDTCGFSTKYQSHLIAHKRIHTGDVFRCQYANCNYYTPKRSQLAAHMRIHMSIRSHICATCGRGFVEKSHLVRHERIHLEEKPFRCEQCDYSSTRRDKLKEHVEKHHGENASAKVPYKPRRPRRQPFDPQLFPGTVAPQQAMTENQSTSKVAVPITDANTLSSHMVAAAAMTGTTVDMRSLGLMLPLMGTGGTSIVDGRLNVTLSGLDNRMNEAIESRIAAAGQDLRVQNTTLDDSDRLSSPLVPTSAINMRNQDQLNQQANIQLALDATNQQLHVQHQHHQMAAAAQLAASHQHQGAPAPDLSGLSALMNMF